MPGQMPDLPGVAVPTWGAATSQDELTWVKCQCGKQQSRAWFITVMRNVKPDGAEGDVEKVHQGSSSLAC